MASSVQLKRSAVQGAIPTTGQLNLGELAINTYDGKLYLKKNVSGTESIVEIGAGGGSGGTSISIGATSPSSPSNGSLWWDSTYGLLKIYYNDGDSSQWVDAFSTLTVGNSGTVSSVDISVPTGLQVSGGPITSSGTLAITLNPAYSIPTTTNQTNWSTAYGWGNHASAGYLTSSAIGISLQGYNANTVIDSVYVHTDNNYTSIEKTKLAGIETGAQVNIQTDWNSVSGTSQILNKPTNLVTTNSAAQLASLTVTGDLNIQGTYTTTNTSTLNVEDTIIYIGRGNTGNINDMGIVGHFNDGTYQHTGLVRDYTDGKWKLFASVTTEPTSTIMWAQASYSTLKLGTIEATTGGTIGGSNILVASNIGSTIQAYAANLTSWGAIATTTKQDTLISATNIKTINGNTLLGSGDLTLSASFAGGTLTSPLILAAGTAAANTSPLKLTTGTNLTTPEAGAVEYDGKVFYATAEASQRGVVPNEQFVILTSPYTTPTGTGNTLKQVFNTTTNGAITLAGNTTYIFEGMYNISSMSATTGAFGVGFGGTVTFTRIQYMTIANKLASNSVQTASSHALWTTVNNSTVSASNTTTIGYVYLKGTLVTGAGGTLIPSISLTLAAPCIIGAGSYFRLTPIGSNTVTYVGNWS